MTPRRLSGFRVATWLFTAVTCVVVATSALAHEVTYKGTVLTVEAKRIEVAVISDDAKPGKSTWFAVDKTTRVKRGDKTVAYAQAQILKDERIVIIINHDAAVAMLATDIRLAARP